MSEASVLITLVRHGQSHWNVEGRLTGWTDIGLTALGQEQAQRLRPRLEGRAFDQVIASDLGRALDTARLAWGEPHRRERRLREMDFGELEGAVWRELDPALHEGLRRFHDFRPPGGESLLDLERRVVEALDEQPPGHHLIFTHGGVFRVVLRAVGPDRFVGNCALATVDWTRKVLLELEELA